MDDLPAQFAKDLQWVRQAVLGLPHYPGPDTVGWEGKTHILHYFTFWHEEWEEVLAECQRQVLDAPDDFSTRYLAVAWAYRIWESRENIDDDDDVPDDDQIAKALNVVNDILSLPVEDAAAPLQCAEWLLMTHALIGDWTGANEAFDRAIRALKPSDYDGRILRGQFHVTVAMAMDKAVGSSAWWQLRVDDAGLGDGPVIENERRDSSIAHLRPFFFLLRGIDKDDASPESLESWSDAAHHLDVANSQKRLPSHYRAVLAYAHLTSGRRSDALALYRELVDENPWDLFHVKGQVLAAGVVAKAGDSTLAATMLEGVVDEVDDPEQQKDVYLTLARLYIEAGAQHDKALAILKKATAKYPPLEDETPIKIALALGQVGVDALDPVATRARFPASKQAKRMAVGVLSQAIPRYQQLRDGTRDSLQQAAVSLFSGDDPKPAVHSVFWVGRAIEEELFHRFIAPIPDRTRRLGGGPDEWTLGRIVQAITDPRSSVDQDARRLASYVDLAVVTWLESDALRPATRWRNAVVHPSMGAEPTRDEAADVFRIALQLFAKMA